ncbi:MAG: hypothetical protein LBP83_05540 [Dysgonamonadaceae bacterium]|jgi:hypothetical protein|nr:hypothetical protein [Dysgonamonadaceae bacterium]
MKPPCISHTQAHENAYSFTRQLVNLLTHFCMKTRFFFLFFPFCLIPK